MLFVLVSGRPQFGRSRESSQWLIAKVLEPITYQAIKFPSRECSLTMTDD